MKKLTLEEVGKLAGVSRATVSRVINNTGNVDPVLRQRVEEVIQETGYRPNLVARSLASNRSNILGLIIPSVAQTLFADPYFPALIQGISQACNTNDYTLSLFIFHSPQEEAQVFNRALGSGLLDGLIVTTNRIEDPFFDQMIDRNLPFVYVGRPHNNLASYVDVDNVIGVLLAVKHLIRLGYQRIAHVAAPLDTTVGIDRKQGYENALIEAGMPVDENMIAVGNFSQDSGYVAMRHLLSKQPDAVFVASDTMALGAIQAIHSAGLRVPEDIAVVGFDDLPPAEKANPPLTTVHQPIIQSGRIAVETLLDILDAGAEPPRHIILPTKLVIRASCGALVD